MSRRSRLAFAGGAAAGLVAVASFGPVVRRAVSTVGGRYGAEVTVERVAPAAVGVRLLGVAVRVGELPGAAIRLDEVDVRVGWSETRVVFRGGAVELVGPRGRVLGDLEAWRAKRLGGSRRGRGEGRALTTAVEGLRVSWKNDASAATEAATATDVSFLREGATTSIEAGEASVAAGPAALAFEDLRLVLVRTEAGYKIETLSTSSVNGEVTLSGQGRPEGDDGEKAAASGPRAARGRAARDAALELARAVDAILQPGATVALSGVAARVRRGDDQLSVGPGTLVVRREGEGLIAELAPGAVAAARHDGEQALTFRVSVPLGESAPSREIVADVDGGPIGLATLGVRDGDFGLLDVGRASLVTRSHVVLSPDGERVALEGSGRIRGLSVQSAALSDEPVRGVELAWSAKGRAALDGSSIELDEAELDVGAIRVLARGEYRGGEEGHRLVGKLDVPLTPCDAMLGSIPAGLVPRLRGLRLAGSFSLDAEARIDTASLDRDFHLAWGAASSCRVVEVPAELGVERFRERFRRTVNGPDGRPVELELGPGTDGWVPYGGISRFVQAALLTCEDASFHRHRGFDEEAIKNSIRENVRKRRFVRGASTISMQLAKNLYLGSKKTLSRKLQEALLTLYLEQELTKEQILELYLNAIEFGPMVYGIGPAARHYFNTSAAQLSLGQSLYIASILPNPKVQHFGKGGAVTPGWTRYLRKLMELAHRRGLVTDEELEEGLRETVVFGQPAPDRAPKPDEQLDAAVPASETLDGIDEAAAGGEEAAGSSTAGAEERAQQR